MNESIMPFSSPAPRSLKNRAVDRIARETMLKMLEKIRWGQIIIRDNDDVYTFGSTTLRFPLSAAIQVHHPGTYTRTVFSGSIGTAEAYMAGLWSTDNLTDLIRIVIRNRQVFKGLDSGWMKLTEPLYKFYHLLRRNTHRGSRANIVAHYDLGNEFYRLFLDKTMTYSAGIFENQTSTLEEASIAKYDRICRKLRLAPQDHVVEIGTGWGGFALYAARHYGCRVTTTTISEQQYETARQRIAQEGLTDRINLLKKDYRHLRGKFDKLVSIEMIEAVGHHYLGTFFTKCCDLLKDHGLMLLQSITIRDQEYDHHCRSVDFIKRYIFPGSCIPSIWAMNRAVKKNTDLTLCHLEDITHHYVRTLCQWRRRFLDHIADVFKLGFSEAFVRMWEYYLCYCEAGFSERHIGDVQMLLAKPMHRFSTE